VSDKTEEPTPRRLARAREKGDVAVSGAASQAAGFVVALFIVPSTVAATAGTATALLRRALATVPQVDPAAGLSTTVVLLVAPLLAVVAAAAALSTVVQTGALFAPQRVTPDLGKLDPLAGLKSLASGQRFWNVARAFVAAVVVALLAWRALSNHLGDLASAIGAPAGAGEIAAHAAGRMARDAAVVGLFLAIIDLVVVRRALHGRLRMSKTEVKQEHREAEGDPQWKAARHRAHQEMLAAATVNAVKDATVVIVNPEHLATALRYVDGEDEAPAVLATGDGDLARRIQEAARAYGIPVIRDVPVARALSELQVGDTIPEALYEAVAAILDEVWREEEKSEPR
jgi:flagellar biosynthesis protein FlhB